MNTYADVDIYKVMEKSCPYCNIEADICSASLSSLRLGILTRLNYCGGDNYDNCAICLAKNLRRR